MTPMRLRTELLVANLLVICALTGAILLIVRHTVRSEIDEQVLETTDTSLRAFRNVQSERELQLSRTASLLTEIPTLKSLMTADALTIQDASEPYWKLAGSDLFVLSDPGGKVLAFHVKTAGWDSSVVASDLRGSIDRGENTAWWYSNGQLYWVFMNPMWLGPESNNSPLGLIAIGYQVDSAVAEHLALGAGSQIVLASQENVIASTLPSSADTELQKWIREQGSALDSNPREMNIAEGQFEVASVLIRNSPAVRCYVLMSLQRPNSFLQQLNRTVVILGVSAVVFAALLLSFVSRTITRPLENLVAGVRALAAGDYAYSITPRGSSEVAELGDAFSRMRDELLASQQRWIATERIAALGRAASSISHDLRHYLAAVVANAEFLYEAEKLNLNRDEIYSEIKMASDQMTDLIDSLRELAHQRSTISAEPADLEEILHRAIEAVKARP